MELDDFKEAWTALDNRLKKTEELKESIILEMMQSKARKKVNWFIANEMINVIGLLLIVPLCIYLLDKNGGKYWELDTFLLLFGAVCFVMTFWSAYKLHGLMKFDLTKNVGNNILCMNKYNIQLNRDKKILAYFLGPIVVIFGVLNYVARNATLPLWTLLICIFIAGGLVVYWSFKMSEKSIKSILKSLEEIRELKEE